MLVLKKNFGLFQPLLSVTVQAKTQLAPLGKTGSATSNLPKSSLLPSSNLLASKTTPASNKGEIVVPSFSLTLVYIYILQVHIYIIYMYITPFSPFFQTIVISIIQVGGMFSETSTVHIT